MKKHLFMLVIVLFSSITTSLAQVSFDYDSSTKDAAYAAPVSKLQKSWQSWQSYYDETYVFKANGAGTLKRVLTQHELEGKYIDVVLSIPITYTKKGTLLTISRHEAKMSCTYSCKEDLSPRLKDEAKRYTDDYYKHYISTHYKDKARIGTSTDKFNIVKLDENVLVLKDEWDMGKSNFVSEAGKAQLR